MALILPLGRDECLGLIAELGWARLAMLTDRGPYAVPMLMTPDGDGQELLFYSLPGRKLTALQAGLGRLAVQIDDASRASAWRSVSVLGSFRERTREDSASLLAEDFRRRETGFASVALRQLERPEAVFGSIVIQEISGRRFVP